MAHICRYREKDLELFDDKLISTNIEIPDRTRSCDVSIKIRFIPKPIYNME